jgi:gas vesicle protein
MTDDWTDIAAAMLRLGAPLIGGALGGPLGATAGRILADALGARNATPGAVGEALDDLGGEAAAAREAVREAEVNFSTALAEVGKAQVSEVGQTQRAEIASDDPLTRWWRPVYALELSLVECPAFALTLLHTLWVGHEAGINGFANVSALLMTYFGARFGVLGVYVTGRSREKEAALTGQPVPGVVGQILKSVGKKR